MKRIARMVSLVFVVALLAALPASTQVVSEDDVAASADNLRMLILINRLELSTEQMNALHDILADLLEQRKGLEELRAELEDAMIAFTGTGDELDEILAAFREDQQALTESLREGTQASIDAVRDLLSINQGAVLREAFPALLGGRELELSRVDGNDSAHIQQMGRGLIMGGRRGAMAPQAWTGEGIEGGQNLQQVPGDVDTEALRARISDRLEQIKDQVPEELYVGMKQRMENALERREQRMTHGVQGGSTAPMGTQSGMALSVRVGMAQRGCPMASPQWNQTSRINGRPGGQGSLFDRIEEFVEALELKMESAQ